MMAPRPAARLSRMEAARRQTAHHLELVRRQITARAERLTITRKAKARRHPRSGSRWTPSDEAMFQDFVEDLTFARRGELDALSRKLARQDLAIEAARRKQRRNLTSPRIPSQSQRTGTMPKPDDFTAGHYAATATVHSTRRNLFSLRPRHERLIATLVSGSLTKIEQFDDDCERIVNALAALDDRATAEQQTPAIRVAAGG